MPAVGIDLGTKHAYVAVSEQGKVRIIENNHGRKLLCCLAFTKNERLIGDVALHQVAKNPENTIYDVKRFIGQDFKTSNSLREKHVWPFNIESCEKGRKTKIEVKYRDELVTFRPEEITSMILSRLKEIAEIDLGKKVTGAVITVPATFTFSQRKATIDAATIAGIEILQIISKTAAVAIDYKARKEVSKRRKVLIFQLGGGTFHASILSIDENCIKVMATVGNSSLGGDDFTTALFNHACEALGKESDLSELRNKKKSVCRLRLACEKAKKDLSLSKVASIKVDSFLNDVDFQLNVTRAQFQKLGEDFVKVMLNDVKDALRRSILTEAEIQEVYFIGGATRMPFITEKFIETFPQWKGKILKTVNVDETAAQGAAALAEILSSTEPQTERESKNLFVRDILPYPVTLDFGNGKNEMLVKQGFAIPFAQLRRLPSASLLSLKVYCGEYLAVDTVMQDKSWHRGNSSSLIILYEVDKNGILKVTPYKPLKTNVKSEIPEGEISKLTERAIAMDEEEKKHRIAVGDLHKFERQVYAEQRRITRTGELNKEERQRIDDICTEELDWILHATDATIISTDEIAERRNAFDKSCQDVLVPRDKENWPRAGYEESHAVLEVRQEHPEEERGDMNVTQSCQTQEIGESKHQHSQSEPGHVENHGSQVKKQENSVEAIEQSNMTQPSATQGVAESKHQYSEDASIVIIDEKEESKNAIGKCGQHVLVTDDEKKTSEAGYEDNRERLEQKQQNSKDVREQITMAREDCKHEIAESKHRNSPEIRLSGVEEKDGFVFVTHQIRKSVDDSATGGEEVKELEKGVFNLSLNDTAKDNQMATGSDSEAVSKVQARKTEVEFCGEKRLQENTKKVCVSTVSINLMKNKKQT